MEKMITVRYGEIAIKGKNRSQFENTLIQNIKNALQGEGFSKIEKKEKRLLVFLKPEARIDMIAEKLKNVFGIEWFSIAFSTVKDLEEIKKLVLEQSVIYKDRTIKVNAKRSDKTFQINSMEINKQIGEVLYNNGFKIDVKNPQVMINLEILRNRANVFFDKIPGLGGLPVGCSGKVLCLLSGGIDSPVASFLMMKRGCEVDFLHVHPLASNEQVKNSKIPKIVEKLDYYFQKKSKLFVVSYTEFYKKTFGINSKDTRNELVLFRRFIIKLANKIAKQYNYLGIVTGDSIAQVASQTLENLMVTSGMSEIPLYRPLLTYDKKEIINIAEKIGTYKISLEEYRDCCSLVANKHPATKAKIEDIERLEENIEIEKIVSDTLEKIAIF